MEILSFNIEGYRRNKLYLKNLLSQCLPRLLFLQEIWLPKHAEDSVNEELLNYSIRLSTPDMFTNNEEKMLTPGQVWHGVAIGWHTSLDSYVTAIESNYDRFAGIRVSLGKYSLLAVSLYAPTHGKDDEFLECLSYLTEFILENITEQDSIIIGADSNCSRKSSGRRRKAWSDFCDNFTLTPHTGPAPTFHHHNGSSDSFIDMILCSKGILPSHVQQLCTLEDATNLSSHDVLTATLSIPLPRHTEGNHSNSYSSFKRRKVVWNEEGLPKYQAFSHKALSDALDFWDSPEYIPLLCSLFSNLLVRSAELVFEVKQSEKSRNKQTVSKAVLTAQKKLKSLHRKWKKDGKPQDRLDPAWAAYSKARSDFQRIARAEENRKFLRLNNSLMQACPSDRNKVYRTLKSVRNTREKATTSLLETPVGTYSGSDVLEGFAADAEFLGKPSNNEGPFDREFYDLCILDNLHIFSFKGDSQIRIPNMTMADLDKILKQKMKLNKACDYYQLTVEHLRYCGEPAKLCILQLINRIINNIYYLTCPQIKIGLGAAVWKGKNKPLSKSKSYRRITVTPQIGVLLDRFIDPIAEKIFLKVQSPDQLGFTAGLNYLMAAVLRGECQRWALDCKQTCFGISLDGEAAFPSVDRTIQVRELYSVGERGDLLNYSKNTYENTQCVIKQGGQLSRRFTEYKGNRQGHVRASSHYKGYINPCLRALNNSNLGFFIGPICITAVSVADDTYLLSGSARSMQGILDLTNFFARRYRIIFNPEKTKMIVTGSKIDMEYYQDIDICKLGGEKISVSENNEHLGLVVSGIKEEEKNIDANIGQCRRSLLGLLGPAYAFKCLLSPTVQIHLWRTYNLPVLRSGLSALPIRPAAMGPLNIFYNKILRSFLKLSQASPIPALHFLLGELPIEGRLHLDFLSLFYNIWENPHTTVNRVVKYLTKMADNNSCTWSAHLRTLCQRYRLPNPLQLLSNGVTLDKTMWKTLTKTNVTVFYERKLRAEALTNSKMKYLNVNVQGLSGIPHIALQNVTSTQDVQKLRYHLKFLSGDFLTAERLARDNNSSSQCKLCQAAVETTAHALTECRATSEVHRDLIPTLLNTVQDIEPNNHLLLSPLPSEHLTQFLLDCTSLNLPDPYRIPAHNPRVGEIFRISRNWCYRTSKLRSRLLYKHNP